MNNNEALYELSRDGMFAAALQHFSNIYESKTEEEETLYRNILAMALTALIPQTVQSEEDRWTIQFIFLAAVRTNLTDIEVRMLNTMNDTASTEVYDLSVELSSMDASLPKGDDDYFKKVAENLIDCIKAAGVVSLKKGFNDLDNLAFMVEEPNDPGRQELLNQLSSN